MKEGDNEERLCRVVGTMLKRVILKVKGDHAIVVQDETQQNKC